MSTKKTATYSQATGPGCTAGRKVVPAAAEGQAVSWLAARSTCCQSAYHHHHHQPNQQQQHHSTFICTKRHILCGGLAQLVATLVGSTKLLYAGLG